MTVLAFFAAFALLECVFVYRSDWSARPFDILRASLLYVFAVLAGVSATFFAAVVFYLWAGWSNPLPAFAQLLIGFLLADYAWYWFHRWSHGRGWRWHVWHHVVTRLNVWMTHVGHPVFNFFASCVRLFPLLFFGVDPSLIVAVGIMQLVWTTSAHLNVPVSFPWLSRWVVTPSLHRWHHAPGARVNFGLCLSVWDRLHGTYHLPSYDPPGLGVKRLQAHLYPPETALFAHLTYPFSR